MLKPKKKITKKELKQDKLVTWYFKLNEKFNQYSKKITTGALIFLGMLLVLYLLVIKPRQENSEIAANALANIIYFYDYQQYQTALQGVPERSVIGLKQIADEYGSTDAGEIAKIYLGNIYLVLKEYDNSMKYYEEYGGSNKMYNVAALSGIASVYEAKKQYNDAAIYFEKAADKSSDEIQIPENLFYAARNYNLAGNKKKAVDILEKIKTNYPKSFYVREIDKYIAEYEG
jgi:tetratricopeptide (TPR) repeat protein